MGSVRTPKVEHDHRADPPQPRKRRQREPWTRDDFFTDLRRATGMIETEIRKDPKEVARLKRRLEDAKKGEGSWGVEDADSQNDDTE